MTRDAMVERIARVLTAHLTGCAFEELSEMSRDSNLSAARAIVDVLPTMADPVTDAEVDTASDEYCRRNGRGGMYAALEAFAEGRAAATAKTDPVSDDEARTAGKALFGVGWDEEEDLAIVRKALEAFAEGRAAAPAKVEHTCPLCAKPMRLELGAKCPCGVYIRKSNGPLQLYDQNPTNSPEPVDVPDAHAAQICICLAGPDGARGCPSHCKQPQTQLEPVDVPEVPEWLHRATTHDMHAYHHIALHIVALTEAVRKLAAR